MSEENKYVSYIDYKDLEYLPPSDELVELAGESKRCTLFDKPTREISTESSEETQSRKDKKISDMIESNSNTYTPSSYLHEMSHDEDPKDVILKRIGSLEGLRLSGAQILVATYIRPERKKSGLILTAKVREEDKFQGKCGLVLKRGPLAYKSTEKLDFGGYEAKVGDWVWYRPMDGYALSVNGVHCRVLDDVEIKGDIDHPDIIV